MKIYSQNKKVFFDYFIEDKFEAGIVLTGNEVKSIKNNQANLLGAYVILSNEEACLINCKISRYKNSFKEFVSEERTIKLLLNKNEIKKLSGLISRKGISILPLKLYEKNGLVKLEIGVGKHKKIYDQKQKIKERDLDREAKRELSEKF